MVLVLLITVISVTVPHIQHPPKNTYFQAIVSNEQKLEHTGGSDGLATSDWLGPLA